MGTRLIRTLGEYYIVVHRFLFWNRRIAATNISNHVLHCSCERSSGGQTHVPFLIRGLDNSIFCPAQPIKRLDSVWAVEVTLLVKTFLKFSL